jgi:hypothetical protein
MRERASLGFGKHEMVNPLRSAFDNNKRFRRMRRDLKRLTLTQRDPWFWPKKLCLCRIR